MTTWLSDTKRKEYSALNRDISTDVVIIGAGMAGSISAYLLSKEGKKVVLLDKSTTEDATTAFTTAWITTDLDTDYADLLKMYGKEKVKAIFDSGNAAIDAFEKIIAEEKIDCEFVRASVFEYATSDDETKMLEDEYEAIKECNLGIDFKKKIEAGFENTSSLEMLHQAKFHPLKFLNAIQEIAVRNGAEIFYNTEAYEMKGDGSVIVTTKNGHTITAEYSIMTTYQPFQNPIELFAKKGMYKSYVFEVSLPKGTIKEGMYLDTHNPYHYFRIDPKDDHDRMILGGEDHRMELPFPEDKSFRALEDFLKDLIPGIEYKIEKKWAGPILENVDGLPYIGLFSKENDRQLVATAFSGTGMHFSMISGRAFRDLILKRENADLVLYDAGRKVKAYNFWKKAVDFTEELIGGALKNLFK
jgi:glycine/D-amino acid oxidase-like deaminating enzyme